MKDETGARHVIDQRAFLVKKKEELTRRKPAVDRDESEKKLLVPLIVKGVLEFLFNLHSLFLLSLGDVAGSLEALLNIITAKQPEELDLEVVHSGVGPISDSDIDAAWAVGGKYCHKYFRYCYHQCMGETSCYTFSWWERTYLD